MSSASNSRAALERLRLDQPIGDVFLPAKRNEETSREEAKPSPAAKPSLSLPSENKRHFATGLDNKVYPPPSVGVPSGLTLLPGSDPGLFSSAIAGHLDLKHLMAASVRRPREGIHPDTYQFGTLIKRRRSMQSDPSELTLELMGAMSSPTTDLEIERFQEYVVFAMRGFGHFTTTLGTGCYGADLEAALKRQSVTHRDVLSRQGVRSPIANRMAKACPVLDWGIDYGAEPNDGALMLGDFIPCPSTKLGEFMISCDKQERRGKPPASIYLDNASMG